MLRLFLYILVSALILFSFFFFFLNLILGAYFHSDNKITRKSILRIERYYKQIQANRLFHYAEVEFNKTYTNLFKGYQYISYKLSIQGTFEQVLTEKMKMLLPSAIYICLAKIIILQRSPPHTNEVPK